VTVTPPQHLAALVLVAIDVLARGARIRLMVPMSLPRALVVNISSDAVAAVTPARLGGELARFVALRRWGASTAALLAASATELLADTAVLLAIAVPCAFVFVRAARAWAVRLVALAGSPATWWVAALVLVATLVGAAVARRLRRRVPAPGGGALREAWRLLWRRPRPVVAALLGLTVVSVAARTAVLPVLAAGISGPHLGALVLGSVGLLVGQAVLPTPSGAGVVDAGFVAGFAGGLSGRDLGKLLLVWRFYSLALGALAGSLLLARAAWMRHRRAAQSPSLPSPFGRRVTVVPLDFT